MAPFTNAAANALLGGVLIGGGVSVLLLLNGRVAGVSGILDRVIVGAIGQQGWRLLFLIGLLLPALIFGLGRAELNPSVLWLVVSGSLVGLGTRVGSGCTSGHGVCGLANLSRRSLVATVLFMTTAMLVVFAVRHVLAE